MTDSPERLSLLRAILDAPGDDLPRLVYADFLEEHAGTVKCGKCRLFDGEHCVYVSFGPESHWERCTTCSGSGEVSDGNRERAEFIRIQVELASLPECDSHCQHRIDWRCVHCALEDRERELLEAYALKWLGEGWLDGRHWVWSRGFVSEIRCSLAQFVGAGCGQCGHQGRYTTSRQQEGGMWLHGIPVDPCPTCHGTGTTPGIEAAVFAIQPIERVVLSDQQPYPGELRSTRNRCAWFHPDVPPGREQRVHHLTEGLFRLIEGFSNGTTPGTNVKWFYSREAAMTALSDACVQYGRALVGLPNLAVASRTL